jgi:hypothetical protein
MRSTCLFWFCGVAGIVVAQEPPPPPHVFHEQQMIIRSDGAAGMQDMKYVAEEFASEHKLVTGAPYSAQAVTGSVQTLADGNHIRHSTTSPVVRDSQGRTRREQPLIGPGQFAESAPLPTLVFINDPVAQVSYVLEPDTKIARSMPAGHRMITTDTAADVVQMKMLSRTHAIKAPELKKESLGSQSINGVRADGTRITKIISAGEIGNEQPIEIVSETWYSPDLQAVVRSKTSDPRTGDSTFELQNIDRSEPAASLFAVPADYTVQEGQGPVTLMRNVQIKE